MRVNSNQRLCFAALLTLAFANLVNAQEVLIVSPSGLDNTEGDTRKTNIFRVGTPVRLQYLHPASEFASLPSDKRTLVGWSFRADQSQASAVTNSYPNAEIRVSTTTASSLSTTYADNIGADETLVLSGDLTVDLPLGGPPRDFGEPFRFTTPFEYDPSQGNLLVDLRFAGGITPAIQLDGQTTPGAVRIVGRFGLRAMDFPTADLSGESVLVGQFIFIPEPSTFMLAVTSFLWTILVRNKYSRS